MIKPFPKFTVGKAQERDQILLEISEIFEENKRN